MCETVGEIHNLAEYLPRIAHEDAAVFQVEVDRRLERLDTLAWSTPEHRPQLQRLCFELCSPELDRGCWYRHVRQKPFGYAGDFLGIDWLYTGATATRGRGRLWDDFLHRQVAAQAVRKRKDYLCETFTRLCMTTSGNRSVLDLACGSCRDVVQAVAEAGDLACGTNIHCVDSDARAIAYAREVVRFQGTAVTFEWEHANAFEIKPERRYDLVWSAGLFDYLKDRHATRLLRRMWDWTKEGGQVVVGNAHPRNPTRAQMEWCMDWTLLHRTDDDMVRLCEQAGIPSDCIKFGQESLGVFAFCIVMRP